MTDTVAAAKRRHRPSALVITGILGLIAALLAGGAGVLVRYQPLRAGSSSLGPQGRTIASQDPDDDRPTIVVQYIDGSTTSFGFSIRNTGRWGVTVVGFGGPEETGGLLDRFSYRMTDIGFTKDEGAFAPFALAPGAERSIQVNAFFANCERYVAGGGSVFDRITVRFTTLGIQRSTQVLFGGQYEVVSPTNANCPRPREA